MVPRSPDLGKLPFVSMFFFGHKNPSSIRPFVHLPSAVPKTLSVRKTNKHPLPAAPFTHVSKVRSSPLALLGGQVPQAVVGIVPDVAGDLDELKGHAGLGVAVGVEADGRVRGGAGDVEAVDEARQAVGAAGPL